MGKTKKPNAIIADTNVYIHDPESIDALRAGGNTLFIEISGFTVRNEVVK